MDAVITLNFDPKALASEVFRQQAQEYFATLPAPDPQYTCEEVAEVLGCTAPTVRGFLKLPLEHPRHLPYVQVLDGPKGRRIRLSAVQAWQARNDARARKQAVVMEVSTRRPARRRNAA